MSDETYIKVRFKEWQRLVDENDKLRKRDEGLRKAAANLLEKTRVYEQIYADDKELRQYRFDAKVALDMPSSW